MPKVLDPHEYMERVDAEIAVNPSKKFQMIVHMPATLAKKLLTDCITHKRPLSVQITQCVSDYYTVTEERRIAAKGPVTAAQPTGGFAGEVLTLLKEKTGYDSDRLFSLLLEQAGVTVLKSILKDQQQKQKELEQLVSS